MPKNLLIAFDGTGNNFKQYLTNVAKVVSNSVFDDEKQLLFYSPGVGTDGFFRKWTKNIVGSTMQKAFGWGITQNIINAYTFLMRHYQDGDKIFITGFSRGAYTARAFSHVLHIVGLLYKGNEHLLGYLARLYLEGNGPEEQAFEKSMCRPIPIHFLGVWDTVDSRGKVDKLLYPLEIDINSSVKYAYHALAIDEKRYMFQPVLMNEQSLYEHQVIEQVWFSGVHADVGGGNPLHGLSDISLQWMLKKAEMCGLILKPDWKKTLDPSIFCPLVESYRGFYKLWKPFHRIIPENSNIHISAVRKEKYTHDYNPVFPKKYDIVEY